MYVEASDCCNKLSFAFSTNPNGVAAVAARMWSIKVKFWQLTSVWCFQDKYFNFQVTQYSCKYNNLAPQGCTQYFYDMITDNVQTYNYNNGNGVHLASQDQTICVRLENQVTLVIYSRVGSLSIMYCTVVYFLVTLQKGKAVLQVMKHIDNITKVCRIKMTIFQFAPFFF